MKVICNKVGSHSLCDGCGAAIPHYKSSCEPCPVMSDAKCVDVDYSINHSKPKIVLLVGGHSPPISYLTGIIGDNSAFVVDSSKNEDERRKAIFLKYKKEHNIIYSVNSKSNPLLSMTYENFKLEYERIKEKQSKLPANIREQIKSLWINLFS